MSYINVILLSFCFVSYVGIFFAGAILRPHLSRRRWRFPVIIVAVLTFMFLIGAQATLLRTPDERDFYKDTFSDLLISESVLGVIVMSLTYLISTRRNRR